MSQVIAVVSGKGGTGKTSFTTLTGMALAQLGKKTLLLDCDIGLRNLDITLGLSDRAPDARHSLRPSCATLSTRTCICSPRP